MSGAAELIAGLRSDGTISATMRNTITSSGKDDSYALTFLSYFPPAVMVYAYGVTAHLQYQINNGPWVDFTITHHTAPSKTIAIPAGTTAFHIQTVSVVVSNPGLCWICSTF